MFDIADKAPLKEGRRHIYFLQPKPASASSQSAA
jgi:hypothetical protein